MLFSGGHLLLQSYLFVSSVKTASSILSKILNANVHSYIDHVQVIFTSTPANLFNVTS